MFFRRFQERLKAYFTFTKRERNGILILLVVMIIMQAFVIYTHFLQPTFVNPQQSLFEKEVLAFEKSISVADSNSHLELKHEDTKEALALPVNKAVHLFDPNKIDDKVWKEFGINEKTIHAISNYLNKGGRFKKKEDLQKIYTLKEEEYRRIEPYIVIEEKIAVDKSEIRDWHKDEKTKSTVLIEINKATVEELMTLPMIGEKRALQIIKYRSLLGGYVEREQLKEIYGLPDSVYQLILPRITVNSDAITHININVDSISFLKHLYIKKPFARLIVNYRLQHGNYHSVEELKKLPLIEDSLFRKISKYLVAE